MSTRQKDFLIILVEVLVIALLVYAIHISITQVGWNWTGITAYTDPEGNYIQGKTLWDLFELIIVPVALGWIAILFNQLATSRERENTAKRMQEANLQAYLDKMTELLLEKDLSRRSVDPGEPVRNVAQTRTITIIRTLDKDRRNIIFQFLRDTGLAKTILLDANLVDVDLSSANLEAVNLSGANLGNANLTDANLFRAHLRNTNLEMADLSGANLKVADLSSAVLRNANLTCADLMGAHLRDTELHSADLREANLVNADMTRANLWRAILRGADLRGADLRNADLHHADLSDVNQVSADLSNAEVTNAQLRVVTSLKFAIMPDGRKYDPEIHKLED